MAAPTLYLVKPPAIKKPEPPAPVCPVCGLTTWALTHLEEWFCDRCEVGMHVECFWGRVATLEEWKDYFERWVKPEEPRNDCPAVLCPSCRAKGGA